MDIRKSRIWKWKGWGKYSRYEWTFLIMGIIAIFIAVTSLFTSLGDTTPDPTLSMENAPAITDPSFEVAVEGIVNNTFKDGGEVKILKNGQEFLPDLLEEIKNASSSINITNYIWDGGEFGDTLLLALIEKAKQGVEVRILFDGLGGRKATNKYQKELEKAGGKIGVFRDLTVGQLTRIHRRTHVRAFIIDGRVAYTGGIAISDNWLGNATSTKSWHDFMFKVEGEMAKETQKVFATMWTQTTGEVLAGEKFYPELSDSSSNSRFISLFSAPSPDMSQTMEHFLWFSLNAAQKSVRIENPYLVLSEPLLELIREKAKQGVEIEIILPGKHTDQKVVQWTSQSYYKGLIDAGINIYEYEPSRIHSKFIVIDSTWSIIGSANLDNRSRELNVESLLGINDPTFATELEKVFEEDKKKSSQVNIKEWKKRAWIIQPLGMLTRFFVKQY